MKRKSVIRAAFDRVISLESDLNRMRLAGQVKLPAHPKQERLVQKHLTPALSHPPVSEPPRPRPLAKDQAPSSHPCQVRSRSRYWQDAGC